MPLSLVELKNFRHRAKLRFFKWNQWPLVHDRPIFDHPAA